MRFFVARSLRRAPEGERWSPRASAELGSRPRPSPGCGTGRLGARPRGSREGLAHSRRLANVPCTSLPPGQLRPVLPEGPRHPRGCRRAGLSTRWSYPPLLLPEPRLVQPGSAWASHPRPASAPCPSGRGSGPAFPRPAGEGTPGFLLQWLSQACPEDTLLLPGPRCPRPAGPAPTPASPAGLGLPPAPHVPPGLSWTSLSPQSGVFPPAPSPPFGRPPGDRGPHDSPRWGRTRVGRHGSPVSHP